MVLVAGLAIRMIDVSVSQAETVDVSSRILSMLKKSLDEKRGVVLYLEGQTIAIVVYEIIGTEAVIGRNREHGEVLIRLPQVQALALN